MKKFLYFLLLPLLCRCSDSLVNEDEASANKLVEVSFNLGGDYDIEFENISRAGVESGDLVAIQVYEGTDYYACGLFNGIPTATLYLKTGKAYKFECRVLKEGVTKIYHDSEGYDYPFLYRTISSVSLYKTPISNQFLYSSYFKYLLEDTYTTGKDQRFGTTTKVTRPNNFISYYGSLADYLPMENGVVRLSLKCNKAPMVTLNFTSDVPDGQVTGTMKYYGYTTQTWAFTNSRNMQFQRNTAPMAQIMDGTWWGGVEQLDFSMTWKRGPEANSFVTQHKNVTLNKTIYLDNDKNYTVNLHFRGQSDSDPEVWVGVDVDPDHTGDLDEDDDSNE